MTALKRIGQQTDILGECPLWDEAAQALWWIDIRRPALRRLEHATGSIDTWTMPDLVGSIALCDDGRLLIALPERIAEFDPRTGVLGATVAAPPTRIPGHRFNDGRCDRQGRWWVGTMHNVTRAPEGVLSVTITGPVLATADAYATAAFAMGAQGPNWTARLRGYEAMTILADETVLSTPGFPAS